MSAHLGKRVTVTAKVKFQLINKDYNKTVIAQDLGLIPVIVRGRITPCLAQVAAESKATTVALPNSGPASCLTICSTTWPGSAGQTLSPPASPLPANGEMCLGCSPETSQGSKARFIVSEVPETQTAGSFSFIVINILRNGTN